MKIKTETPVIDRLTGKPFAIGNESLTFKRAVTDSLNAPPHVFAMAGGGAEMSPKHKAELRGGIIEKMMESDTVEFLPQEADEILFCVSAVQPPMLFLAIKRILDGTNTHVAGNSSKGK